MKRGLDFKDEKGSKTYASSILVKQETSNSLKTINLLMLHIFLTIGRKHVF